MINRRRFLAGTTGLATLITLPEIARAVESELPEGQPVLQPFQPRSASEEDISEEKSSEQMISEEMPPEIAAAPVEISPEIRQALESSGLVYLTPLKSDGNFSQCQAEIWFVQDGDDIVVVSRPQSWRVQAIRRGLTRTRLWIGDLGVWTHAEGRYRNLPFVDAEAREITDARVHPRLLEAYGDKYRSGWLFWRRRFRKGLKDGSRVALKYRIV